MTATPNGLSKAADENADAVANAATAKKKTTPKPKSTLASPAESAPLPTPAAPTDPVPEGEVQVTTKADEGQDSDPAGNVTEVKKVSTKRASKKDVLKDLTDLNKLPVAVTVGQVTASIEEYAGRAVLSLSLLGWVGDAPLKVLAEDADQVELALAELRKQLG